MSGPLVCKENVCEVFPLYNFNIHGKILHFMYNMVLFIHLTLIVGQALFKVLGKDNECTGQNPSIVYVGPCDPDTTILRCG